VSKTVLLVEDERDTRELLTHALERAGYACVATARAREALDRARAGAAIDAVVTDVVLHGDDTGGLRLLVDLRRAGLRAPVIVITAYADVEKVKTALNEGAAHLLEKPFRAAELIEVIERVIAPQDARRPIEDVLDGAHLTAKERTVALHLLAGLSSSEIAEIEKNSPKTIRQHVSQIYAKCGVGSRAELFRLVFVR
jgi:DNA-binding NarL/FixJ family response regulator